MPFRHSVIHKTNIPKMPKKVIFVGSSSEAKTQAKALIKDLASPTIEFLPWWDAFTPGHLLLNDLAAIKTRAHAALLVFTPDIPATLRNTQVALPNQNVLFELGYFYSALSATKIALIKYGATYIPKDLDGYTHIPGSKFFKPGASVVAGKKTTESFNKWVVEL
jgi:predicted nucleotide-binding protein